MFTSFQILIPVYNEAENITNTLSQIAEKVKTQNSITIIFDDDSDTTIPVVNDYLRVNNYSNIFLIKNKYGKGVLNALKTGFDSCTDAVALVVMADSSDDMSIVDNMFAKMNQGYDLVCGSRYMKGGRQIGGPVLKKLMSRAAGISLHLLTGIPTHDISNSFKMYKTDLFREITMESTGGFEIGMELLIKSYLKGHRITELPTTWHDRKAGKSRFQLNKWLPIYIHWYLYFIYHYYQKLINDFFKSSLKRKGT
jgi:dolichol-phosphate mannosyltransferase